MEQDVPAFSKYFISIDDPRIDRAKKHSLQDILIVAICAVICGAEGWEDIELFGKARISWFKTFLDLSNGIPGHDTFRRVFERLSPDQFRTCFTSWIKAVQIFTEGEIIPIDGKVLRRSFDNASSKEAIHMVSAWASKNGMVLGQQKVDDKSNEITAIPKLLERLCIRGCIVTIDAMGCQKNIATQIISQQGDYVLALKGNQGALHADVLLAFESMSPEVLTQKMDDYYRTIDGEHGRIETRKYWMTSNIDWLPQHHAWTGLTSVGIVESIREIGNSVSLERRYYITSLEVNAQKFANAVRSHWGIENSLHWCLDVTFNEDKSRIRKDNAPENFAVLRHIALNLLKQENSKKLSVRKKRLLSGWDNNYLVEILIG
jgi:predicted transposase YbfD/YdcC